MKCKTLGALIFLPFLAFSQQNVNEEKTSSELFFDVKSSAFFDNLEFINNIQKGYTITGFNLEPRIRYSLSDKFSFSAGAHALFYSGEQGYHTIIPALTIHTFLSEKVALNLGTIENRNCHNLPEPIFKPERELINQPETGLQFLFSGNRFDGETWINWEKFLFFGDTIQEEFTVGISGKVKLLENKNFQLDLPVHVLAVHQGGQINVNEIPVSTLANLGGGINLSVPVGTSGKLGFEGLCYLGRDLSPNPHHIYKKGWAIYPRLFFQKKAFLVDAGFWKANSLILPRGQEIFGSVSTVDPFFNSPEREIVTANFVYNKTLIKGFNLTGKVQLYQVLTESTTDFRFAVIASFNEEFLLKRFK